MTEKNLSKAKSLVAQFEAEKKAREKRSQQADAEKERAGVEFEEIEESKIKYPQALGLGQSTQIMLERIEMENEPYEDTFTFDYYPWDGAAALHTVVEMMDGHMRQIERKGGFFSPDQPPQRIEVKVDGEGNTIMVPWGDISVYRWEYGVLTTGYREENGQLKFQLSVNVKKKFQAEVEIFIQEIKRELNENSIYKGKAIRLNFRDKNEKRDRGAVMPELFSIKNEQVDNVVYNASVEPVVKTNLMDPLRFPEEARELGISLKRGALLEGPYGTGKTLTGYQMAHVGMANGYTFIYVKNVEDFELAMNFARQYAPAIIFAEDIDTIAKKTGKERTKAAQQLTTVLDGVDSKKDEIFSVFTTNFVNRLDSVFTRPGRIDIIVRLEAPDLEAAVKITRQKATDGAGVTLIDASVTDEELAEAIKPLVERNAPGAYYAEVIKRTSFSTLEPFAKTRERPALSAADIHTAVLSSLPHLELHLGENDANSPENHDASFELVEEKSNVEVKLEELLEKVDNIEAAAC